MDSLSNNAYCEIIARLNGAMGYCFLDNNNVSWKIVDDNWIGKRVVVMNDLSYRWLDEVKCFDDIRLYPCGESADYNEVFRRNDIISK